MQILLIRDKPQPSVERQRGIAAQDIERDRQTSDRRLLLEIADQRARNATHLILGKELHLAEMDFVRPTHDLEQADIPALDYNHLGAVEVGQHALALRVLVPG